MPVIDMPLDQLRQYHGINPCPKDFDEFWLRALAEMNAVKPDIEMIPAEFQAPFADCFDLYFTGVRGARIHAKLVKPKHICHPSPAVLHFHGYTGNSGLWTEKLCYAASGYVTASLDCRGQGGKSEDTGHVKGNTLNGHIIRGLDDDTENMLMRHIFLDTAQLAKIIMEMPEVDETRVGVFGGSQGGALSMACAALEPRINRLAVYYPFLCDYQRVWQLDFVEHAYAELTSYFRRFDPMHQNELEVFERLGYIDIQNFSSAIKGEVILGAGLMDRVCPPSSYYAAFNKITAPKRDYVYPDFGHEPLPGFADITFDFMMKML